MIDKISVNTSGNPAEHANSMIFTDIASVITPTKASKRLFSAVNFFILENICFLFLSSTTSHPESFFIDLI